MRSRAVLVVLGLLLTACGSTVQNDGSAASGGEAVSGDGAVGNDGLGVSDPGPAGPSAGNGTVSSGVGTGSGGTGTASGGSTPGGTASGQASSSASGGVGPGVTDTEIALGIPYCADCASANAALGAGGEDPGDTRRYAQAALDEVNARGGVLGRKLVPVFHEVSVADNIDVSQQEACETFTTDNKVLLMFFRGEIIYECARKAGILVGGSGGSGPVFEKYPNMFATASIRLERLFEVTVKSMVTAGWHKPDTTWPTGKIGVITWDDNEYRYATEHGYLKGLHEAGLKETDVRYVAVPQSANSVADASSAISNAILAFRSQGIDHVYIGDGPAGIFTGAGLTLLFLTNAKSQNYYPRYGFNSNNAPDFDSHPKDQLVGMIAIDSFDTSAANDEGIELNPVRERCFAVMKERDLLVGQGQTQAVAIAACEMAWFTEAVLNRTRDTTLPYMIAAGESLGTSFRSPYSYGNRLGPGQHDGVSLFRSLMWDEACECIKYTSKPFEP